jgi:predicted secreted protein
MDNNRKVILIPRCVLMPGFKNSSATSCDELKEMIKVLLDSETGIIQLPCPYLLAIISREKDGCIDDISVKTIAAENNNYMVLYGEVLKPIILEIEEYRKHGAHFAGLIGVKDSPFCRVDFSNNIQTGNWGLFMKILVNKLNERSIALNMVNI